MNVPTHGDLKYFNQIQNFEGFVIVLTCRLLTPAVKCLMSTIMYVYLVRVHHAMLRIVNLSHLTWPNIWSDSVTV